MADWKEFKHITKLDPDKKNTDAIIKAVGDSNTDAIMISGTQGITHANVNDLYKLLMDIDKPILIEPVHKSTVLYDVDFIYAPVVLNTSVLAWINGLHLDWMTEIIEKNTDMPWDRVVSEGYIILNPDSAVAQVTKAKTDLSVNEVSAYANYGQLLGLDAVYIEYSGIYGDVAKVSAVKPYLKRSSLFYGGGISNNDQTQEMLNFADTIFVGNIVYSSIEAFLSTIPEN